MSHRLSTAAPSRALASTVLLLALASLHSCRSDDPQGTRDAAPMCCPIEPPSCNCFQYGGTGPSCASICDAPQDGWVEDVDENGCPILRMVPSESSCFPPDFDAGPPDAQPIDAAPDAGLDGCRGQGDCPDNGEFCLGPNDINCGVAPREQCIGNSDCGGGSVCHTIADGCSFDGVGSECGPPCVGGDSCGVGFECDPDLGACRPLACDDAAVSCPASQLCDPTTIDPNGAVHAITDGCTRIQCQNDTPCPKGTVCVNGTCQDGPGTCSLPAP